MSLVPRRVIKNMQAVTHGGFDHAELAALGLKPGDVIDFSVSTNPFMPPPGLRELLAEAPIDRYPDSRSTELTDKLAERLGISPGHILAGSGTTELIRAVAITYFRHRDTVLVLEPTYGEYEPAVRLAGARIIKYRAGEENNFVPDINAVTELIAKHRPRAVFVCNPNNPTGYLYSREAIERMVDASGDTLLILDEAYMTFIEAGWSSLALTERANVISLRSMTKDYGLPGLRLGYAVARAEIIESLRLSLPPWNVNAPAQAAGLAVLDRDDYLKQSLQQIQEARDYLTKEIAGMGFTVMPSDASYFLVKVGNATECRRSLLKHGIMVRDCTSFGLPGYIRVSPRSLPDCRKLTAALSILLEPEA
ncbi:MAG: histidinol-phosphate aminotransferase family protein [Dehalococcoidales bacterium]|nr:histidinol-phosphate aminotransferase family protein [Dehalococcoidales bacterium]